MLRASALRGRVVGYGLYRVTKWLGFCKAVRVFIASHANAAIRRLADFAEITATLTEQTVRLLGRQRRDRAARLIHFGNDGQDHPTNFESERALYSAE